MLINQVANSISLNDAVSKQIFAIKNKLKSLGYNSNIFAYWIDANINDDSVFSLQNYVGGDKVPEKLFESDIVIYHHYNKSLLIELLKKLRCKKILYYHNITPPHFFQQYDHKLTLDQQSGLDQLQILKSVCMISVGSTYNVIELEKLGFTNVNEIPYYFDMKKYSKKNQRTSSNNKTYDNIIFIGRIAPNKKHVDLIKIFYYYSNFINPNSRLFITGTIDQNNPDPYQAKLITLLRKLDLENKVIFTGLINWKDLLSLYRIADVFVCMSEHEGFCVPIVESMLMQVPVIAYNSSAIPFTLKNSGILVNEKDHKLIAHLIKKIINDKNLRSKIISEQLEVSQKEYNYNKFSTSLLSLIKNASN